MKSPELSYKGVIMNSDSQSKVKLLLNEGYGGFSLGKGSLEWLIEQGYTREQAWNISDGNCPRDLPILFEAYQKFPESSIVVKTVDKGTHYYIENYDGAETLITIDDLVEVATGEEREKWKPSCN